MMTWSYLSQVSGSRNRLAKGAKPVPVARNHSRLPGRRASCTTVPTGFGRRMISSPTWMCCSREVRGPSGTLIE